MPWKGFMAIASDGCAVSLELRAATTGGEVVAISWASGDEGAVGAMTTDSRQIVPLSAGADRDAIRMEYEATGADGRVLVLLDDLEQAERMISEQIKRIRELEARLTRSPAYSPGEVFLRK